MLAIVELFANPAFLVAGGAAVSAPIIIHLINRMRFKRVRWAAMEFLLKAQKRSRRRLIIEQLLLLLLRCLLVALIGLLVARFLGWSLGDIFATQQENLHVVVLDDTLSLRDQHKDEQGDRNAFDVARKDVLVETILKNVSQSTTNDRVAVIPLSRVATEPDFKPKVYERLNTTSFLNQAVDECMKLEPSKAHVDLVRGVDLAQQLIGANSEKKVTVHVVSDFRKRDWVGLEAKSLHEALSKLSKQKAGKNNVKVRLIDTAHPFRVEGAGGAPPFHDNVGIVDMRATTRVTGKGMPVGFAVTVANFSPRDRDVFLKVYNEAGDELLDVTFNERMPLKVPANETAVATFDYKFFPELKENETAFATLSARLESAAGGNLDDDGLLEDNVRHVSVEIRNKVPVLVIDGRDLKGLQTNGDSFFIDHALASIVGSSYQVVHASKLTGGDARTILDSPDLSQYPTLLMLNVPSLNEKQLKNLENYVSQGGGVAFFLGPLVDAAHYNKELYRDGKGVFPVPLEEKFFPPRGAPELPAEFTDRAQLLLRDDNFPGKDEKVPVFGPILKEPKLLAFLKHLPVKRYYPTAPQAEWKNPEVREIANLPNEQPAARFEQDAKRISDDLKTILDQDEYRIFRDGLEKRRSAVVQATSPLSKLAANQFADILKNLVTDGGTQPTEFWKQSDPKIDTLLKEIERVRKEALYSHPMLVASKFGQGRVVAVMTTAGKEWNDWAGGITGSVLFAPIVWEMQNYLSSTSGEAGQAVATPLVTHADRKRYGNKPLMVTRYLIKPYQGKDKAQAQAKPQIRFLLEGDRHPDQPGIKVEVKPAPDAKGEGKGNGKPNGDGKPAPAQPAIPEGTDTFTFTKTLEPGLYLTELRHQDARPGTPPLQTWGQVFNVDTRREGRLQRAAMEELDSGFLREAPEIKMGGPQGDDGATLINKQSDLSEWPWFFLILLAILVAEQALAVHLSFHLKGNEAELPSQVVKPHG